MSATFLRQNQTPSERIKQQKREWYYRNRKSVLRQQKKSEERKESKKEWYEKNREVCIAKSLDWNIQNPSKENPQSKNILIVILPEQNSGNPTISPTICNWNGLRILDGWKHLIHQRVNYQND